MKRIVQLLGVSAFVFLTGCASLSDSYTLAIEDPNAEAEMILEQYYQHLNAGVECHPDHRAKSFADCDGLLVRASHLYTGFPQNERVRLTLALMLYQSDRKAQASFLLDQLLAGSRPRPEAAILRARMAMEEGNTGLASSLLTQQLRNNPLHSQLHEVMSAVHFLNRNYPGAFQELSLSERLGAPDWRVAYHRGLIFEHQRDIAAACEQYVFAYTRNPEFVAPQSRLLALADQPVCFDLAQFIGG